MICNRPLLEAGGVLVNKPCPECEHPLAVHRPHPASAVAYCSMCDSEHILAQLYGMGPRKTG